MGPRMRADELRELLAVARKLRLAVQDEKDEDLLDLYLRAALALEHRAWLLALQPPGQDALAIAGDPVLAALHKPIDIVC